MAGTALLNGPPICPGEHVAVSGFVHVVSVLDPAAGGGFTGLIHFNSAGITGQGLTTGSLYIGTGAFKFIPPDPVLPQEPIRVAATFDLQPTNGCASTPLPLGFKLNFNSAGTLLPTSTVHTGQTD